MNAQSLKKLSVIKEIWFWLPSGYRWTEKSQPRTGLWLANCLPNLKSLSPPTTKIWILNMKMWVVLG